MEIVSPEGKVIGSSADREMIEPCEPLRRRRETGDISEVGILLRATKVVSKKQCDEPESTRAEKDNGTLSEKFGKRFSESGTDENDIARGMFKDISEERAAALSVTSVVRSDSTQLRIRTEASELRSIFSPHPSWMWRHWM